MEPTVIQVPVIREALAYQHLVEGNPGENNNKQRR
jgi:hypothetical protein